MRCTNHEGVRNKDVEMPDLGQLTGMESLVLSSDENPYTPRIVSNQLLQLLHKTECSEDEPVYALSILYTYIFCHFCCILSISGLGFTSNAGCINCSHPQPT